MKLAINFLILALAGAPIAYSAETPRLFVYSSVKNFAVAEEASYLLQCVSANTGRELEFTSDKTTAKPRVFLTDEKDGLKISVVTASDKWSETVAKEEILGECGKIETLMADPGVPILAPSPETPAIPNLHAEASEPSWFARNKTALMIAGGVAVLAGAFFYVHGKKETPSFSSVRPEF